MTERREQELLARLVEGRAALGKETTLADWIRFRAEHEFDYRDVSEMEVK